MLFAYSAGKTVSENAIATFSVDHKTGRELGQYLSSVADQCEKRELSELPHVIILDGLHHVAGPLSDTFTGFLHIDSRSR